MTGRTLYPYCRFYADGYDLSGYTRQFGPLVWEYEEYESTALTDGSKNVLVGHPTISPQVLNGILDNTATVGLHIVASTAGVERTVMIPIGDRAAPAAGDPVFCGQFPQKDYKMEGDGIVHASVNFGPWSTSADSLLYDQPWGLLLLAKSAKTAANSATGAGIDNGAASTAGGYLVYQVFSGDGTATISIDDSADDSSYSALSGATSGEIDFSNPTAGLVALGKTATVRRYLRWQLSLNTASSVTFALAFVRGR